jgi:threonylcarbamoyladenosine tRNA methylthiotransferase MtaB
VARGTRVPERQAASTLPGGVATFTTRFLGCKVSFADEQAIRERLLADGHREVAADVHNADVAVINTCCVTNEAVAKSRQAAARAARTHERVYVTGCAANLTGNAFAGLPANVRVIGRRSEEVAEAVAGDVGAIACVQDDHRLDRVRAFVKIQDGCSFSCAFCVIPLVRGGTRSRSAAAVLSEIRRRVAQGHREVVLTGVNLGCFRDRELRLTLAGLIRTAGSIDGLERLRLSSIEVNHVTPELIAAVRETPNVSPHLHIPLQSGDDAVLRAMGRRYTIGQFRRRIEDLDDFNLTTDVIVGFPAEDERAFANTMRAVASAGMTKVHVFPYSPRPGTRTAGDDPVPTAAKKDRSARLRAASAAACRARWERRVGSEDVVLLDRPGRGYADDYTPWLVDGAVGEMVRAKAIGVSAEGVLAVAA